jgi:hypothetical protein
MVGVILAAGLLEGVFAGSLKVTEPAFGVLIREWCSAFLFCSGLVV